MRTTALTPPKHSNAILVSFPQEHVMLLTFNRPKQLNAMNAQMAADIGVVLDWFDKQPELWIVIVTGAGRTFCAGADLLEWNDRQAAGGAEQDQQNILTGVNGFGNISRRASSSKPMIAAVNGGTHGGGLEIVLNCDLVVAAEDAQFALPEVKVGVVAIQGGMPRLARIAGHQLASELLLLGRTVTATDAAARFGFVNKVVPRGRVVATALEMAAAVCENSPDAIQSTKRALLLANQHGSVEDTVMAHVKSPESKRVFSGDNMQEGLKAFTEKRKPIWKSPAKL